MISLYDLLKNSKGQLFGEPVDQLFVSLCLDIDKAAPNQLFVAHRADHGDSHRHIPRAIKQGVSGILCEYPPECNTNGVTVILVQDAVEALLSWTHYTLGKFGTKVIAVAGTVGKSTTIDIINRVLTTRYSVLADPNSDGGPLSIPLALSRLTVDHKFAIIKLATVNVGEMATMVPAIRPEVGLITYVGDAYANKFESPAHIAKETGVLIDYLSPSDFALLNYDDDLLRAMAGNTRAQVGTIGMANFGADMIAYNVISILGGTKFDLRHGDERHINQYVTLTGKYQLYGMMAAVSIGLRYGIPVEDALDSLVNIKPLPGHMHQLRGKNGSLLIDDTYNATPQSVLATLDWLEGVKVDRKRSFMVFGDMQNLGIYGKAGHRMIGKRAAEVVDVLVTSGVESALTARVALDYGADADNVHATYNTQDAIKILDNLYKLEEEDLVFLTGGQNSKIEQVTQALLQNPDDNEQLVHDDTGTEIIAISQPSQPTWVEIDAEALAGNVRAVKALIGDDVSLLAIVKANGYGHGAVLTAQTALLNGAEQLGVSSLTEALELRDVGITAPILILNYTPPYLVHHAIQQNITLMLYDLEVARAYDRIARKMGTVLRAHFKIDSGMGRLGDLPSNTIHLFRRLLALQNIDVEGIFTHFSVADSDPEYTTWQLQVFEDVIRPLRATSGFRFKYVHAANSAATIAHPEAHFNMVRPGLALYGMHPSDTVRLPDEFRPVMTWKTIVMQVKTLPSGHNVGYGNTYTTRGEETIAVLPVGYADGFRRAPNNWGEVLINGQRASIAGRVSMEKTTVRISHIPDVAIGDEVVLLGKQGDDAITAEEVAENLGTINYEITCAALPRAPRS